MSHYGMRPGIAASVFLLGPELNVGKSRIRTIRHYEECCNFHFISPLSVRSPKTDTAPSWSQILAYCFACPFVVAHRLVPSLVRGSPV
jgi:hypothetical protein